MDYEHLKSYLYGLMNYGTTYGVDRMRLLVDKIGHPEQKFPVIHVAGTNGKGSVCAMLEAIYRKNGYRTGLFTSPHLVHLTERIQVDRKVISEQEMIQYIEYLKDIVEGLHREHPNECPSFFEIINAVGFLYFSKEKVDIGIIETGLGGRFDSTNVVDPLISVITSISKDHTEILGDSLESIAFAKAGIIKPGKPVVIGRLGPEAKAIILDIAREKKSHVFSVEEAFGNDWERYPETSLQGTYQRNNAATAILVADVLKKSFPIDEDIAREALKDVDWPGRWQTVALGNNKLILDCAHNEAGAEVLGENLEHLIKEEGKKPIIIVGVLGAYRAKAIIPIVAKYAETIILVKPKNCKAAELELLKTLVPENFYGNVVEASVAKLFPYPNFIELNTDGRSIVATGSIYLIGEILERIQK